MFLLTIAAGSITGTLLGGLLLLGVVPSLVLVPLLMLLLLISPVKGDTGSRASGDCEVGADPNPLTLL